MYAQLHQARGGAHRLQEQWTSMEGTDLNKTVTSCYHGCAIEPVTLVLAHAPGRKSQACSMLLQEQILSGGVASTAVLAVQPKLTGTKKNNVVRKHNTLKMKDEE